MLDGKLVRVVSWYDNEWGFSNRMVDTAGAMAAFLWAMGVLAGIAATADRADRSSFSIRSASRSRRGLPAIFAARWSGPQGEKRRVSLIERTDWGMRRWPRLHVDHPLVGAPGRTC